MPVIANNYQNWLSGSVPNRLVHTSKKKSESVWDREGGRCENSKNLFFFLGIL